MSTAPPVISSHPGEQEVEEGGDAVFVCGVEGKPEPAVFWNMEGNHSLLFPGESTGRLKASIDPAGHTALTIQVQSDVPSKSKGTCCTIRTTIGPTARHPPH